MKRALLSLIGCLLLAGCDDRYTQSVPMFANNTNGFKTDFKYAVTVIGRCEYITYPGPDGYVNITHKGDCTNCVYELHKWMLENPSK
jgi:hypothetical protein